MKKILVLLAVLLVAGTAFAQDVYWSGWFETRGQVDMQGDADPTLQFGATTFDYTLNVAGEGFGFGSTLEYWAGQGSDPDPTTGWVELSTGWAESGLSNLRNLDTYIYADHFDGMLRLTGGYKMQRGNYTPAPAVEGGLLVNLWGENFGRGFGAYNYLTDYNYFNKVTGLIVDIMPADGVKIGLMLRNDNTQATMEDVFMNGLILNAQYDIPETATVYAGYAARTDAGAIWLAASISAIENVLADLKFEYDMAEGEGMMIAANLGYSMDAVSIKSQIEFDAVEDANALMVGLSVAPSIDVIGLSANVAVVAGLDAETTAYGFTLKASKSIGNVGNSLEVGMTQDADDTQDPVISARYSLTIWF